MKRPPLQRASAATQKAAIAVVTAKVSEGQQETHAVQQLPALFNQLVGAQ
jgi:hypothetical protein